MTSQRSMQSLVKDYLDERRRCGFALTSPAFQLMAFARLADQSGHCGPVTRRIILDWVQGQRPSAKRMAWAGRASFWIEDEVIAWLDAHITAERMAA